MKTKNASFRCVFLLRQRRLRQGLSEFEPRFEVSLFDRSDFPER